MRRVTGPELAFDRPALGPFEDQTSAIPDRLRQAHRPSLPGLFASRGTPVRLVLTITLGYTGNEFMKHVFPSARTAHQDAFLLDSYAHPAALAPTGAVHRRLLHPDSQAVP